MIQHAALKNNRAYLLHTEITKSHLNNHICQYRGMKTSMVTPSFYYVFNISWYCNNTIPSFIGNLWRVLLLGNHLKMDYNWQNVKSISSSHIFLNAPKQTMISSSSVDSLSLCSNCILFLSKEGLILHDTF